MKKLCKALLFSMLAACSLCTLPSCGVTEPKETTPAETNAPETNAPTIDETTAETEAPAPLTAPLVTPMNGENGIDFIIEFPEGKEITVLQFADLQMIDLSGVRNEPRTEEWRNAYFSHGIHDHETRTWRYMDEAMERANPDLIVLTGDNIYGESDDDGSLWLELCAKMDSYGVPWLVVFGNHDNESGKGVMWQIEQLQNSEYCVFSQGNVTGNSNYNVVIKQGDEYKYLFYMLDTNGCHGYNEPGGGLLADNPDIDKLAQEAGIYDDQLQWMRDTSASIAEEFGTLPVLMFLHIPPVESGIAASTYSDYAPQYFPYSPFAPDDNGDMGWALEILSGFDRGNGFYAAAKEIGCVGMFVGHQHKVATSILYDGIRITYGLKTGTYAYHEPDMLGGTKITIAEDNSFAVEYLESELEYIG